MYQNMGMPQGGMQMPFVPDEPFFQAISAGKKDRKGRYVLKRGMGGMVAGTVGWFAFLLVFMVVNIAVSGSFSLFDIVIVTMMLFSIGMTVAMFFKQRRKIVMDQDGITFVTGSKKSVVAYADVTGVSALVPFRMQAQSVPVFEELGEQQPAQHRPAIVSFALFLRDQQGQEFQFPVVGQGFADRFDLLISKLANMGFEGEFEKVYALYLSHRVDLRSRTILPPNAAQTMQDPFGL